MKSNLIIAVVLLQAVIARPAMAVTLTATDQLYLNSVQPAPGTRIAQMDEETQARIHAAIHDPATAHDPDARRRAVAYLLDQYRNGWLWSLGRR
jgi:hypothetical protein